MFPTNTVPTGPGLSREHLPNKRKERNEVVWPDRKLWRGNCDGRHT